MKPKIKSIHFREDERGTRYIEVTFTDNKCICITALTVGTTNRMTVTLNYQDRYRRILDNVCNACSSYLLGDEKETISFGELVSAEVCYQIHCCRNNININNELYKQAEFDFTSRLSHFEDWDA